ncbi:TrmB family transcriptional regulator [Haloarchaeobius amylolyticus]|uniref:TrmB family transcriptional regulator n=1 Tax=Haloarchaeobius amylolyticus TaxID=1198296 RepID=UPI00227080BF|nr:TrmB family transcriptional regulator [Haloarchaeobius amylolyticus]
MDSDELREVLQEAGLSPYQSKAYVALLELGTASARELVEASDVPDPRIYDVVRSLEDRGYVETYEQDTMRARAHSPADVLDDLQNRASRFEQAADEIEDRWEQPELDRHAASIVKRFETVVDRARLFIQEAENQIQLSASIEQYEQLRGVLADALDRGVYIQLSIYTNPDDDVELPAEEQLAATTTEARHRPIPSPFVALIDRQKACFGPHEDALNEYGVLVDDRMHEYIFHWYYSSCLWEICDEIYSSRNDEPPIEYVDVREFIRDVEPMLLDDLSVGVRVVGKDVSTGEERELEGEVADVFYEGDDYRGTREIPLAQLAGRASVTVATDEGEFTVGGEGAMLEDVEAMRLTITSASE